MDRADQNSSFCSPLVLLEYLKKRLLGARSAATLTDNHSEDSVFPDWMGLYQDQDEVIDWSMVARIHLGIVKVLNLWVEEFFVDFHSDFALRDAFLEFLVLLAKEFGLWDDHSSTYEELPELIDQILNSFDDVREKFERQFYSPMQDTNYTRSYQIPRFAIPVHCPLDFLEDFVDNFESLIGSAFSAVKLVDWMITFEILEMQSADANGFLVSKSVAQGFEEDDVFQNVFLILKNLQRAEGQGTIFDNLPQSVKHLALMQAEITDSVTLMIIDNQINAEERSQRIFSLLRCVGLCRRRMSTLDVYEKSANSRSHQSIPSLVGSAIVNALASTESRIFSHAWSVAGELAMGRVPDLESLQSVIPTISDELKSTASMTPCPAWLLDRMLEIICNVPNMLIESSRLINFDKRRYVFNLVSNFFGVEHMDESMRENHTKKTHITQTRIANLRGSRNANDRKLLREVAFRENAATKSNRTRVFTKLIQKEQDKRRRDNKYRDAVEKQMKEHLRASQKGKGSLKPESTEKKSGRRLGVNSLFRAVRPLSVAISSSWAPPHSSRVIPPSELPIMCLQG